MPFVRIFFTPMHHLALKYCLEHQPKLTSFRGFAATIFLLCDFFQIQIDDVVVAIDVEPAAAVVVVGACCCF